MESTEHVTMAPDSSSATSSCNSSTPSSPAIGAVYHLSPSGYIPTRSADYTGHSQTFEFPGNPSVFVLFPSLTVVIILGLLRRGDDDYDC